MNLVVFFVFLGLVLFNLLGTGIYHYEWKHDEQHKNWKCKQFYMWTIYLILFGAAYCVLRLILWLVKLFKK